MLLWAGLASVMAVWGVCFRLTFWELSWDVMEPVTYFIGSGTGNACAYRLSLLASKALCSCLPCMPGLHEADCLRICVHH